VRPAGVLLGVAQTSGSEGGGPATGADFAEIGIDPHLGKVRAEAVVGKLLGPGPGFGGAGSDKAVAAVAGEQRRHADPRMWRTAYVNKPVGEVEIGIGEAGKW